VVAVEDPGRLLNIKAVFGLNVPGKRRQPVEIGAYDRDLRREGVHLLQATRLLLGLLSHLGGHTAISDLRPDIGGLARLGIGFPQLLLDRLHLLSQEVLPLGLVDLLLHLAMDLRLELEDVKLLSQDDAEALKPLLRINRAQHIVADLPLQIEGGGDEVGEPARLVDVHGHHIGVFRDVSG